MIWSLQSCTAYLDGATKIVMVTDHHSLIYVLKQKVLPAWHVRLIQSVAHLGDFEIIHHPGTDPQVSLADRLSRNEFTMDETTTWYNLKQNMETISAVTTRG